LLTPRHHVAAFVNQRVTRIARLYRHADLEMPRVILRAGERRDFSFLQTWARTLGKPMFGKPTVATVPPNFTARLAVTGNAANRPSALSNARSLADSTFTTLAEINPTLVTNRTQPR